MSKVCAALLILMLTSTVCYGAASEDISVYVRKDVFEAHMRRIDDKLDMILEAQKEMQEELKSQRRDLNELARAISILSTRVDGLEARMGDLRNDIYLGLVILGIVVGLPAVQKMLQNRASNQPSITLEDVRRLIQEELRKTASV
ncbi:MAG: hypothetical protein IJQ74_04610 [Synergistaceae bacterium]|nr:hypothetical protein [Synergistaceae bacterium]MBQ6114914.1 hypothetical protein [Synergistaceae bacterium]MBQ6419306.1 hypothetical protein [Synergistaceae bacterium]MBQ6919589.1 hypothetical protein [Synergistaceae bacterium]